MPDGSISAGYGTIAGLVVLIAASVWLGLLAQRVVERGSFMKGYFLGNRGLGSWALALTATVQSGGTFMGFPSLVFTNGWVVALWIGAYMVVPISGFGIIGKRFAQLSRRTGAITVPDLFRERFGNANVGLVASLLILFFMTVMMVAQFKAGAIVMKVSIPEDIRNLIGEDQSEYGTWYRIGLAVFTVTVVGYTLIGGFLAAVWTDLFQSLIMWVGVMLLLPLTLLAVGGMAAATHQLKNEVSAKKLNADAVAKHAPTRAPAEERLKQLDAALRQYAANHEGALPPDLGQVSAELREDPISGRPLEYYGAGYQVAQAGAVRRVVVAMTPTAEAEDPTADAAEEPGDEAGWQSVLYSNGVVKSGVFSNPGDLLTAPGPHDFHPIGTAFSYFFIWVFAGLGSPAGMVRVMACRDTQTIRRSIVLLGSYNLCIYIPLIVICVCGRALLPDLAVSDEIVPSLAVQTTSHFAGGSLVAGLILSAPFGAVMATVSSYLVVIASGLVRDVYQQFLNPNATEGQLRRLSYAVMVVVGGIGIGANIHPVDFLQKIVVFSGTCGATAFVAPALMIAYWRRATAAGTIAGMLCGVGVTLTMYGIGMAKFSEFTPFRPFDIDPIIWGLAASAVAGVLVSLRTLPPDEGLISKLFDIETAKS